MNGTPVAKMSIASTIEAIASANDPVIVTLSRLRRSLPVAQFRAIENEIRLRLADVR
jgi:hypothetical protein